MRHYRVYMSKEPGGRIVKGKDLHAVNDTEALAEAAADEDCPVCELWQSTKKVGSIE